MVVRSLFAALLAAAALSLGACDRAEDRPAAQPLPADAPASAEPAGVPPDGAVDATRVVDRAPAADAAPGFDVKAFAGTFDAEGARLQLAADGSYTLTVRAESAGADLETTGTWTVEAGGRELLLDPDAKEAADQRYAISSAVELVAADGGRILRRDGT